MSIAFSGDKLSISFQKQLHIFETKEVKHTKIDLEHLVLDATISDSYAFIATNNKTVHSYTLDGKRLSDRTLKKQPTRVCRINEDQFVVADRFGDLLYLQVQINEDKTSVFKKTSAAGHLALISDMVYSNGFLVSSDREESIWVTRFPKTWVIENFCFGHRKFVSKICLVGEDTLISGGGDGFLCVFNWKNGSLRSKLKIMDGDLPRTFSVTNIVSCEGRILVTTNQKPEILVFSLDDGTLKLERTHALECEEVTSMLFHEGMGALLLIDKAGTLTSLTAALEPFSSDICTFIKDTLKSSLPENVVFKPLYEIFPRHVQTREKNMKPKKRKGDSSTDGKSSKKQKTEEPKQES